MTYKSQSTWIHRILTIARSIWSSFTHQYVIQGGVADYSGDMFTLLTSWVLRVWCLIS